MTDNYGMFRGWARILPFFIIEWYVNKYTQSTGTLSVPLGESIPVNFEQVYGGVFLCTSRQVKLQQRKNDIERELEAIEEELEAIEEELAVSQSANKGEGAPVSEKKE
jgi:hypothetical protein